MWGCGRVNGMGGSEGLRSSVTMLLSRYEHMTTDFRGWTAKLLRALPSSVHCVARTQSSPFGHVHREADRAYLAKLERTLQAPFEDSFRPDGKHRHADAGRQLAQAVSAERSTNSSRLNTSRISGSTVFATVQTVLGLYDEHVDEPWSLSLQCDHVS